MNVQQSHFHPYQLAEGNWSYDDGNFQAMWPQRANIFKIRLLSELRYILAGNERDDIEERLACGHFLSDGLLALCDLQIVDSQNL